ncbi:hypothetical protein PV04_09931 [Phialophora macrospora]|uniref:Uncharacterized protein n=1 Tax=Phialophora macrospora TaxID=1851006 RepID=A0A0D2F5A8_9EURO|nr:hypothetical protein PV04_09931 [Phialophora macrospora]
MSMNYRALDPSVYGIKIKSTPRVSTSGDADDKETRDKASGDASHNTSSTQSSSASLTALDATSNSNQGVRQFVGGIRSGELPSSPTITPTLSSTVARHSPRREPASTNQQAKHELRRQRFQEGQKRRRRERIAKAVGHEIDSDGEREYWRAKFDRFAAEEARRAALSPEARRQEDIEGAAELFRAHIKPVLAFDYAGAAHLRHYPLFLLQSAPNGAACRLRHCSDRIAPGQYRIAVSPGAGYPRGPDHYHVKCFEHLLDLSSLHYVARFEPDRQKHMPDHGAHCILEEYVSRWRLRAKQTPRHETRLQPSPGAEVVGAESSRTQANPAAGNEDAKATESRVPPEAQPEPAAPEQIPAAPNENLMQTPSAAGTATQSSSASEKQMVEPDVWEIADTLWAQVRHAEAEASKEHNNLHDILLHLDDVVDDDDDEDPEDVTSPPTDQDPPWHITDYLLPDDHPDYDERHALSRALEGWESDIMLANADSGELTEAGRAAKAELGEPAIKRIKRYQAVRMPDYQALLLGRP